MIVFVESVAILAPGLEGWAVARPILAGEKTHEATPLAAPVADLLPPVERRRTGAPVKFALAVGQEALANAGRPVDAVPTVFVSSGSDGDVINDICTTLAGPDRQISPTRFHNSVHNAPSGYWGIATHSHQPSISLCGFDWSFPIGLMEAAAQVATGQRECLLIAYDTIYPEPLKGVRPVTQSFGAALLLGRNRTDSSLAALDIDLRSGSGEISRMRDASLERLRLDNSSARALPLLAALASARRQTVIIERDAGQMLGIAVQPC